MLAVPVAAADALARFKGLVDEVVCLRAPRRFAAVGAYYRDFTEVSEGEVIALLARARGRMSGEGAPVLRDEGGVMRVRRVRRDASMGDRGRPLR